MITKSTLMDSSLFIAQNSHTRNPQTKLFAGNSHSLRSKTPREVCSLLSFSGILFLLEQFSRKVINTLAWFFSNIKVYNPFYHFTNRPTHYHRDSNYRWAFALHCWRRTKYLQANCRCQNWNLALWSIPQC